MSKWRQFGIWLRGPEGSAWMMVILTVVIAATGVVGIILVIKSGKDTEKMITAAQQQACAAQHNAAAAQQFADTAVLINGNVNDAVGKLDAQAKASAASVRIAVEALHVTERAYITVGGPVPQLESHIVGLSVTNSGHIPPGLVRADVYEATINAESTYTGPVHPIEQHSKHTEIQSVAVGTNSFLRVSIPAATPDMVNNGHQQIIIAGTVSYNDGFPNTPVRTWLFCDQTNYSQLAKTLGWAPCDPVASIRQLTELH